MGLGARPSRWQRCRTGEGEGSGDKGPRRLLRGGGALRRLGRAAGEGAGTAASQRNLGGDAVRWIWARRCTERRRILPLRLSPVLHRQTPKMKKTQRYIKKLKYLFVVFSNDKTKKKILSTNRFSGDRIFIFRLCLSDNPK